MIYYFKGSFSADTVSIDIASLVFKFGFGFFETLFYNGKSICYLEEHISRIRRSLDFYRIRHEVPDFGQVIEGTLRRNELEGAHARVNIYYPIESESSPVTPLVAAFPYTVNEDKSFRLATSPFHHQSHLCAHKTMNHMHFYLARREAKSRGFDDALLVDHEGRVLETSTGSLLFHDGEMLFAPSGTGRLPGVALQVAREATEIGEKNVTVDQVPEFRYVYVLNSLIGAKPVVRVDDIVYPSDIVTCSRISSAVLQV